jgi:hypothetical protein
VLPLRVPIHLANEPLNSRQILLGQSLTPIVIDRLDFYCRHQVVQVAQRIGVPNEHPLVEGCVRSWGVRLTSDRRFYQVQHL